MIGQFRTSVTPCSGASAERRDDSRPLSSPCRLFYSFHHHLREGVPMHPNAELMRKAAELLNTGDVPGFLALHTDDVVMHIPGSGPLAGDYRGRDAIAAEMQK